MIITIQDKTIDSKEIRKLYPAVLVKTGHEDEVTEISLEWFDTEGTNHVEVTGYGIFITTTDKRKLSFIFNTRKEMEEDIEKIAEQLNQI